MSLTPSVFWAQTETRITLKVDLKDVQVCVCYSFTICHANPPHFQSANILFSPREVNYSSSAKGQDYNFTLPLYEAIDKSRCTHKVTASRVDIVLEKEVEEWWPRLTSTPQKPHFLKIDFDKWRPSKEDEDAFADEEKENKHVHQDQERSRQLLEDYPNIMDQVEQEELGYRRESFKKVYLLMYNLVQFIGFLYVCLVMGIQYGKRGPAFIPETYQYVGNAMKFFQLLQFLEVMHPLFGYTRNSMLVPFMQTSGRGFILFAMIEAEQRIQSKPVVFYLFLVWSIIEIVRYVQQKSDKRKKTSQMLISFSDTRTTS